MIVTTTQAILESCGYKTEIAYYGSEAGEVARRFRPEFLLIDVMMRQEERSRRCYRD